jgi:hypothetical protein
VGDRPSIIAGRGRRGAGAAVASGVSGDHARSKLLTRQRFADDRLAGAQVPRRSTEPTDPRSLLPTRVPVCRQTGRAHRQPRRHPRRRRAVAGRRVQPAALADEGA